MSDFETLAERIRAEAAQAARPAQIDRLEAIADEVARLKRACEDLGNSLMVWMNLAVDATGSHDLIEDDGDGDWGAVADRMAELATRDLTPADGGEWVPFTCACGGEFRTTLPAVVCPECGTVTTVITPADGGTNEHA